MNDTRPAAPAAPASGPPRVHPALHAAIAAGIVLGAVAIIVALVAMRPRRPPAPPPDERPVVELADLVVGPQRLDVEAMGSVVAVDDFALAAEVAGRIAWIAPQLEEAGGFAAGEPLLRIEDADYRAALASARARAASARLELAREEALATQAMTEWKRLGSGDASALALREPQLMAARAAIAAADAAIEAAQRDLDRCAVAAPYAGRVRRRAVEVGQLVARGQALVEIHRADAVELPLAVDAAELAALGIGADFSAARAGGPGPRAELQRDAPSSDPARTWSGRVVRAGGGYDPSTRLATVIVRIEDPFAGEDPLLPGAFVRARLQGRIVERALAVPRQALGEDGRIWLVDERMRLLAHRATVLRAGRDRAIVAADLPAGARLVLTRLPRATPGQAVRLAERSASEARPATEPPR